MTTIGGDSDLGWNPYHGAPLCGYCGSMKANAYDKCLCEERGNTSPIDYNSREYREFIEWLDNGGKLTNSAGNRV